MCEAAHVCVTVRVIVCDTEGVVVCLYVQTHAHVWCIHMDRQKGWEGENERNNHLSYLQFS